MKSFFNSSFKKILLSFFLGSSILTFFSTIQKIIIDAPLISRGFIVPVFFGGFTAIIITYLNLQFHKSEMKKKEELEKSYEQLKSYKDKVEELNQELNKEKRLLRAIIDNSPNFIFVKDTRGRYILANQALAELYNTSINDLLGKKDIDFLNLQEEVDSVKEIDKKVIENQEGLIVSEFKFQDDKGQIRYLRIFKAPLNEVEKEEQLLLGIAVDISKLKEATQAAEAANRAKSEFLANMSHEIRTPLNAVIGFSEILENKLLEPQFQSYLKSIKNAGNNLLKLINNILDISKIEAGRLEVKKEWLDPCSILQELESIFAYRAEEKGITFIKKCNLLSDLDYQSTLIKIKLDETRLRQVLINLVANAVKFTNQGQIEVLIEAEKIDADKLYLEFIVADTGIGISEAEYENIFKAFTQQKEQGYEYGGTGLGLTISQRLAEKMGGRIEFESELGVGSTFKAIFREVEYTIQKRAGEVGRLDHDLVRFYSQGVLIIDDVDSNLELLKIKLEAKGLEVLTASSGPEALELLRENKVQLIFIDLKMPDLDGYQTKDLIVEELNEEIPLIALTAFATSEEKNKAKEAGFTAFLTKPVQEDVLFTELIKYLDYQLLEEEFEKEDLRGEIIIEEEVDLENLRAALKEKSLLARFEEAKKLMIINEVEELAQDLEEISQEYGANNLNIYARNLIIKCQEFELEALQSSLSNLSAWKELLEG